MKISAFPRLALLLAFAVLLAAAAPGIATAEDTQNATPSLLENPAQEPENRFNHAAQFYSDCIARPVIPVNKDTDTAFCACASASLQSWLDRPENIKKEDALTGIATIKEINKNTLLSEAYGPCLHIPIYDLTYDDCYYDSKKHLFTNEPARRRAYCTCMAEEDAAYFRDFAKPFLDLKISEQKDIVDPVEEIRKDTNYYDAKFFYERACFAKWSKKK